MNDRLPTLSNRKHLSVAIQVTIAIHVLALLLLFDWRLWPVSLAMVAVNHGVIAAAGLWPRSTLLGPNHRRLSAQASAAGEVALTIDDGPDPQVTPQVLELLDRYGCKATFFCIGERVAAHPDIAREIVRRGHHIENHSQHHSMRFSMMGPPRMRREILEAQETIGAITGQPPKYFRAPAGLRNPLLEGVLGSEGLELVSWTRRGFDTVTNDPKVVLARLTRNMRAGDILLLHDSHCARTADGSAVILKVLPELLSAFAAAGLVAVTLRQDLPNARLTAA